MGKYLLKTRSQPNSVVKRETSGFFESIDKLDAVTFVALLLQLKSMEEQGLLICQEDQGGFRFVPSQLFQPKLLSESESESKSE